MDMENPYGLETEFASCLSLVSKPEPIGREERDAIIATADRSLGYVSARRFCDMTEEFFLEGGIDSNMFAEIQMDTEDYVLFDNIVNSYRASCVSLFGKGIIPRSDYYDDLDVTEENMASDLFDNLGYNTHIFLRAITKKRENEIISHMAGDKALSQAVTNRLNYFDEKYSDGEDDDMEEIPEEMIPPQEKKPETDEERIAFLMKQYERSLVYSLPGMHMGDEAPLPLAIQTQSWIMSRCLASEDAENIPIGALYSEEEIKEMVEQRKKSLSSGARPSPQRR